MIVHTKIEPMVGEEFEYAGIKAKCILDDPHDFFNCPNCVFHNSEQCDTICCADHERLDESQVHFVKLKKDDEKTH